LPLPARRLSSWLNEIYVTHRPGALATELGFHLHADADVLALDADEAREKQGVYAVEFHKDQRERHFLQKFLRSKIAHRPRMDPARCRQLEPLGRATAIHAVRSRRRVLVPAFLAMAAEEFLFGQPV